MRLPFYVTRTFSFNQSDFHITSEGYLLNHTEEALSNLNMQVERLNENALFYRKTDFIKMMNRKNILRTLEVHLETNNRLILVTLKTEIVRLTFYCLVLFCILYFGPFNFTLVMTIVIPAVIWLVVILQKKIVLSTVKHDLIHYFEQLKH